MMKNFYLCLLAGILLSLAWPCYGFSLLIFISFVPLLILERNIREENRKTKRKVFFFSYLTFLIFNAITTWWIWNSTMVGALFAIFVNSLLMTIVFVCYHLVAKRTSEKKSLIFLVSLWICFEKFHHNWDFSWPWLSLGNVFSEDYFWVQWYEFTGIFGGTLWIWIINIMLYFSVLKFISKEIDFKKFTISVSKAILGIAFPIIVSLFQYRFYTEEGTPQEIVVLQPNIDPYQEKYSFTNNEISDLLIQLTKKEITPNTSFVITPETVFADNIPFESVKNSEEIFKIEEFLKSYPKTNFLGGISMYQIIFNKEKTNPQSNFIKDKNIWFNDYNSAFLIDTQRNINFYHKSKLVIGVENFPFQSLLSESVKNLMIDLGGTIALKTIQNERTPLKTIDNQKIAPIICYESIYGEFVSGFVKNGAEFLGILTNDAWWGNTQGHQQLLSYTRLRAIETRKSIARSSNTGISAFINQKGDVLNSLAYETRGALKNTILLNQKKTFYTIYGDYIARISLFVMVFLLLLTFSKRRFSLKNIE